MRERLNELCYVAVWHEGESVMTQSIEIQMLPTWEQENIKVMEHLTNMINHVYAVSEDNLWLHGAVRTTVAEMVELTSDGEIAVARANGKIVGCVRVRQIDKETGGFGMLAVDETYQGYGIGRALINFAEGRFQKGKISKMQLELLVPEEGSHPAKEMLEKWYTRIGYERIRTEPIDASFPELAQLLAIPSKFLVFQKELR